MSAALAEQYLNLAAWVVLDTAKRMPPMRPDGVEDLIACANVALVEVAGRYNPDGGAKFMTYAVPRIRGAVLDELRRQDWASRGARTDGNRMKAVEAALAGELDRTPTRDEVADRLGVTPERLARLEYDLHRALVVHLDGLLYSPDGPALDLPDAAAGPEALMIGQEELRHLHACITALPSPHAEVVRRHFLAEQTLTVIAADMGLTVARLSQISGRAMTLLRAALCRVWELDEPPKSGGHRAHREETQYVERAVLLCRGSAGMVAA